MSKIILISFLLFTTILKAQTGVSFANFDEVDNKINNFLSTWNINSAGVAITKNGKLIYNKGFGFSNQKKTKLAEPNDLYRIASVSKPVTSIAIMKLVQEGKLSLSDTVFGVNKILDQPYYLNVVTDKHVYSVTVKNLLEHTSGWDRSIPCDGYEHSDPAFFPLHVSSVLEEPNPVGDSTLIKFSLLKGLHHKPGSKYSYSNVGYLVLGKVIEKVSGMKYETYIEENILKPLSIYDMHLGKNLLKDVQERESEYMSKFRTESAYGDGTTVPWQYGGFNIEAMNAHGGWIASAADLVKLMLAADGFNSFPDILTPATINAMKEPGDINSYYAKGWSVNGKNCWHTGSMDGTSSFVCITNDGYTWAFLFNSRSDNSDEFWDAFDRLPWNCLKAMKDIQDVNLFAPDKNASDLSATVLSAGNVNITWKKGSGDGRIILVTENICFPEVPVDGIEYKANSAFGIGTEISPGTFVVYNGEGDNVNLSGLDPSKSYVVTAYEYYKNLQTANNTVYRLGGAEKKVITAHPVYTQDF